MATVYVIWGSTYLGIAIAIETMPPFLMAAFRFAVAGLLLLGWDVLRDPAARHLPTRRELLHSAVVGILLLGIANGFVAFGEQTVPSGIAAILIGMVPLWLALLGWVYYRERLPRIVGLSRGIDMIAQGTGVTPAEAAEIGLVDRLFPAASLQSEALAYATQLASGPTEAIGHAKVAATLGYGLTLDAGLAIEREGIARVFSTEDAEEGIRAFGEKRKPHFKGR